ncbi:cysteine--tRNA ligase [Candidatus Pseudomonas adelgestsugas]|uniref:Cysteine--tRNA ligase n=1 Tax=Candidatus Pseudomonas adelgestsugas TaxID=1302376 RepID=A0ABX5R8E8_9PSED|nr:cysteine--tRNA ligase [Candidatus Pseudomonas adelgestsugas]QAX81927.1 Cysteine--tRNA ligase [Candidatus Pseudomonas adelgestsugas]
MLTIYNTLSQTKEVFQPLNGNKVRMYVCGITVYDYCHIGHGRSMVTFDLVTRWLRFSGYDLTYVRNITDIEDKIINRAKENCEPFHVLTERMIIAMHEDEARLNILKPDTEPRATDYISSILRMIQTLIDKGYAYCAPGNSGVYYRIAKFIGYGRLSRKKIEDLRIYTRVDVDDAKQDQLDFVLWKAAKPGEPSWESPWGAGRPGWHIECSVMSTCCLGETFDIHGGGSDLKFPHHENEIAQSEAATGKTYANTWMHCGMIRINGEKMSKSSHNFVVIRDVLKKYHPEVVRYLLISSHYRSVVNYSEDSLKDAKGALERLYHSLKGLQGGVPPTGGEVFVARFTEVMNNDFSTPEACAILFKMAREINRLRESNLNAASGLAARLKELASVLGILQMEAVDFLQASAARCVDTVEVYTLIQARLVARANKDWAESDHIRKQLNSMGVLLEDGKSETLWRLTDEA